MYERTEGYETVFQGQGFYQSMDCKYQGKFIWMFCYSIQLASDNSLCKKSIYHSINSEVR